MIKKISALELTSEHKELLDELVKQTYRIAESEQKEENKFLEQWLETTIKTKAKPTIDGDITLGKLRWRGIKIHRVWDDRDGSTNYEVKQRSDILGVLKFRFDRENLKMIVTVTKC